MSREDFFNKADFLKAGDLKHKQIVTIEKFEAIKTRLSKQRDGKPSPILRLVGFEKPLGVNATNYDKLVEKFGEDESKWAGKKVRVIITTAPNPSLGGKEGPAIRLE